MWVWMILVMMQTQINRIVAPMCVSTQSLFNIGNAILSDIFERKNGDVPQAQRAGCRLKKILQVIEFRVSHQAESIKNAKLTLYEVVASWVQQLKVQTNL
ncbi:hypothetical protein PIB30_025201 [Stylosanthes scabra]|uniref:Uncharacterized protein n=1 Tax=Stylosanthes scabra TaxID=79078 RepID=A0ABU6QAH6_9FABA|nr:hypothetical protein [Stylosanthes scabra]